MRRLTATPSASSNTHLESLDEQVRVAQMQELIETLATETVPILLLGDFNSPAPDGTAYQLLLSAGYIDLWETDVHGTGNTCCQDPELKNQSSELYKRIDLILIGDHRLQPTAVDIQILGATPAGGYPSNHAGVVAHILR